MQTFLTKKGKALKYFTYISEIWTLYKLGAEEYFVNKSNLQ